MSMCHWIVEGIGINTNKLYKYLDRDKCLAFLEKHEIYLTEEDKESFTAEQFEDYVDSKFISYGEAFYYCDDSDYLTYGDNGDGEYFLIYTPRYPWQMNENEPKSINEVHELVRNAVHKLCNITDDEINELIDNDIYEYGCG